MESDGLFQNDVVVSVSVLAVWIMNITYIGVWFLDVSRVSVCGLITVKG